MRTISFACDARDRLVPDAVAVTVTVAVFESRSIAFASDAAAARDAFHFQMTDPSFPSIRFVLGRLFDSHRSVCQATEAEHRISRRIWGLSKRRLRSSVRVRTLLLLMRIDWWIRVAVVHLAARALQLLLSFRIQFSRIGLSDRQFLLQLNSL